MKKIIYVLLIGFISVIIYGCGLGLFIPEFGVQSAAPYWERSEVSQIVQAPYEKTIDATKSAIQSLKLDIVKEKKTKESTRIKSKSSRGLEILVDIRPVTEYSSKITIRVGIDSDAAEGDKIFKRIPLYL